MVAYVRELQAGEPVVVGGDASKGRELYRSNGCEACHRIGSEGAAYGYALNGIGAKRSPEHLMRAIVAPDADVPDGYRLVSFHTASGRKIKTTPEREDTFAVWIREPDGAIRSFWKDDLRDWRSLKGKSAMPSYAELLTEDEVRDLAAYLSSLR